MKAKFERLKFPLVLLSVLALLAGLWAGLYRIGWRIPPLTPSLVSAHGPIMVSGFLGSLITLERAVALRLKWTYLPPILSSAGWLTIMLWQDSLVGPILFTLASFGGIAILIEITRREFALHTVTILLGMTAWAAGNVLWLLGWPVYQMAGLWQAYLVLTIAGERLELSRVLRPAARQKYLFGGIALIYLMGVVFSLFNLQTGVRIMGAGTLLLAVWSIKNDIAWRNLNHKMPITRYISWSLALGLIWLGISGILNLIFGGQVAGPRYDAQLHAIFVGFVMSMIFGHSLIIFPAILGIQIQFKPLFYANLILLHLSLGLRIIADYANQITLRKWGGMLNEIAILGFVLMTAMAINKSRQLKSKSAQSRPLNQPLKEQT